MKLSVTRSKNSASLYVTKSIYVDGNYTSVVVEPLGTYAHLLEKLNGEDPYEWARSYIKELNRQEKEEQQNIIVKYSPRKQLAKGKQRSVHGGYLFLQGIVK